MFHDSQPSSRALKAIAVALIAIALVSCEAKPVSGAVMGRRLSGTTYYLYIAKDAAPHNKVWWRVTPNEFANCSNKEHFPECGMKAKG